MHVRVWTDTEWRRWGPYFVRLLRTLGYRTTLRVLPAGLPYYHKVDDSRTHAQIGPFFWLADYPSPASFLDPNFSCAGREPASPNSLNPSQLCSPALDRLTAAALAARGPATETAWRKVQRRFAALAPAVPMSTERRTVFSSPRAGNVQQSPMWGTLLEQVWVK
jgi:ABC-type oligopeptide transport system substrate-binding subunit